MQHGEDNRLQRRLVVMFSTGFAFMIVMQLAIFYVLDVFQDVKKQSDEISKPLSLGLLDVANQMSHFFEIQAEANGTQDLDTLTSLSHSYRDATILKKPFEQIKVAASRLASSPDEIGLQKSLNEQIQKTFVEMDELIRIDINYKGALTEALQNKIAFKANLKALDDQLELMIKTAFSIAGKIRFMQRRGQSTIDERLEKKQFNDETAQLIKDNLSGKEASASKVVGELITNALNIGKQATEMGLASDMDTLNSIVGNKIPQSVDALSRNLNELRELYGKEQGIVEKIVELETIFETVRNRVQNKEAVESLFVIKMKTLKAEKSAKDLQKSTSDISKKVSGYIDSIGSLSQKSTQLLQEQAALKQRNIQYTAAGIGIIGIILALVGVFRIRNDVNELKKKNETLQSMADEIKEMNASLERKVEERTKTIRELVDNVKSGFFVINSNLILQDGFTKSCSEILARPLAEGMCLTKVLGFSARHAEHFRLTIDQVFEDFMPEEVSIGQIPERHVLGDRVISLKASVIRNDTNAVERLLFTLNDITDLEHAEYENQKNLAMMKILLNRSAFISFVKDYVDSLNRAQGLLNVKDQSEVRMILHTLKGNAGSFGLSKISSLIHEIEENPLIDVSDLANIREALVKLLSANKSILQIDIDAEPEEFFKVSLKDLEGLRSKLSAPPVEFVKYVTSWVQKLGQKSAMDLLGPIQDSFASLCERLGKDVKLSLENAHELFEPDHVSDVFHAIPHAIRNAIDHGIESPWDRGQKPAQGTVTIGFSQTESAYFITIKDDGRGIDAEKLVSSAIKKGVISAKEAQKMKHEQRLLLIFAQGVSTAESVTDVSGRGVGVGALKEAVIRSGGSIEVMSQIGKGTSFEISLPKLTHSLAA